MGIRCSSCHCQKPGQIQEITSTSTDSKKRVTKKEESARLIQRCWRAYQSRKASQKQTPRGIASKMTNYEEREIRPKFTFPGGATYTGQWVGENRDGYGIQLWPDGARYEGFWKNNQANGKGKFTHVNGDTYDGDWVNDVADGVGMYTHADGPKYLGQWKNDKKNGIGVETWPDGSFYQGEFHNQQKQGKGTYKWNNGQCYEGQFHMNEMHGQGVMIWPDGKKYEGELYYGKMQGYGTFTWSDGRRYEGYYVNDKKHGFGTYDWGDGRRYEGLWVDGKQHGQGVYYKDGVKKVGHWQYEYNKLIIIMKHNHLFEDGNYIEFSINENTKFKSFTFQSIPHLAAVQVFDVSADFDELTEIPESAISTQLISIKTAPKRNIFQRILKMIPVFHPTDYGLIFWQFLMVIINLSYFFYIPLKIAFTDDLQDLNPNNNPAVNTYLLFSIIVLGFDLGVSFNTGYNEDGKIILERKKVVNHYLILEFELDFIGVLSLILSYVLDLDIIRLLFYVRLYYVVRFDNKIDHQLLLKKKWKGIYLLLKLILVMLFVAHIMACIFYGISYSEFFKDEGGYLPYIDTWIVYNRYVSNGEAIYNSTLIDRYTASFYWAITTVSTNGYGDITPKNNSEIGWTLLTMILAGMVFAFNISSIRETLIDMNQAYLQEKNYETIINRYMKTKNISMKTQARIVDYFQYVWKQERFRNREVEELLISKLAPDLRQELQYETYIDFARCNFFYYMYFSDQFLFEITEFMEEQPYGPKEELSFQDSQGDQYLIYLQEGEVLIYVDSCYNQMEVKTRIDYCTKGKCLGQQSFVMDQQFQFKAQTQSWCMIYRIVRSKFISVLNKHQKDFELFHMHINKRYSDPYEFYSKLDLKCFTCMSESHLADTCDVTHYSPLDYVFKIRVKDDKWHREPFDRKRKKQHKATFISHVVKRIAIDFMQREKNKKMASRQQLDSSFEDEDIDEVDEQQQNDIGEIKQMLGIILKEMGGEIEQVHHKPFIPQKPMFDPTERSFCIDQVHNYEHFYPKYNLVTIINRIF